MSSNAVSKKMSFSVAVNSTSFQKSINNALRDPERARRFTASIVSAVSTNPGLQECDAGTIVTAALLGESLNLSPSPQLGQYYLVPYNDKKRGKVAQFQLANLLADELKAGQHVDSSTSNTGLYFESSRYMQEQNFTSIASEWNSKWCRLAGRDTCPHAIE